MKWNQAYRRTLACLLSIFLLASLAGCGGAPAGDRPADSPDSGPASELAGPDRPSKAASPSLPTDVENNGGDFVRVGGKVYFRRYGADALETTAVFGEFTTSWNYAGGESRILSCDTSTGEVREVMDQAGYGPLFYGDGGFYLQERAGERQRVVWHSLDGTQSEYLCNGTVLGITPGGLLAVRWDRDWTGGADQFRLYRNTALVCSADLAENEIFAGLTEDGLFYLTETRVETDDDAELQILRELWQLAPDGERISLGVLPPPEEEFYFDTVIGDFVQGRGCVGVSAGYYAGTGHVLVESVYVTAVPGQADSLAVPDVPAAETGEEDRDGPAFRLTEDADGEIAFVPHLRNELRCLWDSGDLERWDGQAWQTLIPGFAAFHEDGTGYRKIVQSAQWVDGAAYVAVACAHAAPAENIGWRDAYTLLSMLYLRVTEDGEVQELAAVDYGALLCGMAWFLDGEEALLWQEVGEDGGWSEVNGVYRIPIAPDAVWDGGKESILDHAAWASLTELDEASYYGYPIPDTGTEELLYLRLNRDGEAVFLTETAPNALLSIQMGMPESELEGAVEAVNVQRRDSDEDTPWYWAKLTALQDGVAVRLERTPDSNHGMEYYTIMEARFVPGSTLSRRVLNRGEYIAVRASLPWYPEMRVSAGKDGLWGAYVFGEDNYLHLENEDGSIPEKTLAGYALPDVSAYGGIPDTLVHGGDWFCYGEDSAGEGSAALAAVEFTPQSGLELSQRYTSYDTLDVTVSTSDEDGDRLYADWDWLYGGPGSTPDLLCLHTADGDSAGDYRVDLYRTDGLELLHLTQVNNGDGILSRLLPGGENKTDFTLVRWRGAGEPGVKLRNVTAPAVVVRQERDGNAVWLREAEQVDVREDGSPVYMPIPGAPCLCYAYAVEAEIPDGAWPMRVCAVSIDRDAVVCGTEGL